MFREDSDEVLMLRFRDGDVEAYRTLVMRYRHSLMSFAYRFVGDTHVAEDVFQDAFLRIARDASRYRPTAKFCTLLYTIARNLCIDHLRKQRYRKHLSLERNQGHDEEEATLSDLLKSQDVGASREMFRKDLKKVLMKGIHSLPIEQREVFLLREYEGLRFREIAKITRTSVNTAKSRMRYALAALRKFLTDEKITEEVLQNEVY
jgi:RNA polymerase sigma-70 factor (ECF subfamily)